MQEYPGPGAFRPAVAPSEDDLTIDLARIARTLWLGAWWILLCAAAALGVGWYAGVHTATRLHAATSEMALLVESQPMLDLQAVVRGFSGSQTAFSTELAIVTSGEMMGRLVDELGLVGDPEFNPYIPDPAEAERGPVGRALAAALGALRAVLPDGTEAEEEPPTPERERQATAQQLREAIEATGGLDDYVFEITATTTDPAKSVLIANTLARLYRDDQIRQKVELTDRTAAWLSERVGELRAELDARQDAIVEAQARSALVSDESLAALNEEAIELRAALRDAEEALAEAGERVAALGAAQGGADPLAVAATVEDGQLAGAAAAAAASGSPEDMARLERRLDQLALQAAADRDRAALRVEELGRSVDGLGARFESQAADFRALQELEREARATEVLYETFLARLKETSVQDGVQAADSRILTEAAEARQVAPRPALTLALSLLLGLAAGSGAVLLREFLQSTFRSAEELERHLGRPVLGQIPRIPVRGRSDTVRYLRQKPTSSAAEAVRNLRTSILLSEAERPPQVIVTTSSVPAEGKTTVTVALAQNLAGLSRRVLLIEGDIRRRTFESYFGRCPQGGGLLAAVAGEVPLEAAVLRPEGVGIDVLMGAASPVNAADLFASEGFQRLLGEARAAYDHVLIDTPPVLVVPDARVIAQLADAVVYVVHWDRTGRSQVEEGLRLFRAGQAEVTGLVLSRIDPKGMRRYGYGGRYGPYSRYAKGYYGR